MFIEFHNGSTWQVAGSDNYNSLVGSSPCGIVFSEYALADPAAWAYLRPILRENKGWAVFISTPRGHNHFHNLHTHAFTDPVWFAQTLPVDVTGLLTEEELQQELRELQAEHGESYGRSIWLQEWYCSFEAAIPGSFWADSLDKVQTNGRIVDFPIDPTKPVYTGWDLGRVDDTSIWFYQINGEYLDFFDYFSQPNFEVEDAEDPDKSLVHLLLKKQREHGFLRYATNWVPHDARPRRQGMGGKSILQQFQDAAKRYPSLGRFAVVPKLDVQEGIQAARKTFQRSRFHKTRCELGLSALRHYHREWDPELRKYNDTPKHDWSSHGADAFRYVSLSWKLQRPEMPDSPLVDKLLTGDESKQTWGALRERHFQRKRRERAWRYV
jgi:hypothetical protein